MPYTRAELVKAAREAGLGPVSERLVTDWVSKGLLDEPERTGHGKGGGSGARYLWSENQCELFVSLLRKRHEVKTIAGLCVLPVGIWMYWGDAWIPLRQVRRALLTWLDTAGKPRVSQSERNARLIVNSLSPRQAPRRVTSALEDCLAQALDTGEFYTELVEQLVGELLSLGPGKGSWGPFGATAHGVVNAMRSMAVAMRRYEELTDGIFYEVRARNMPIVATYVRDWPRLSQDQVWGISFERERPSLEFLINNSCQHLVMQLGLKLIALDEGQELPSVELQSWRSTPNFIKDIPARIPNR